MRKSEWSVLAWQSSSHRPGSVESSRDKLHGAPLFAAAPLAPLQKQIENGRVKEFLSHLQAPREDRQLIRLEAMLHER